MKKWPLVIEELMSPDWISAHYSKGHHDKSVFCDDLNDYWRDEAFCKPEEITHEHWRWVPTPHGEYDMEMQKSEAGKRGAFPVTVLWRDS